MNKSQVKQILEKSNYLLASKTLLSSIYIRNDIFKKLKSPMEYDSLIKFIKSNEKETKNK